MRGALLVDTRGSARAGDESPLPSYFPATPLMSLTWWLHGSTEWLDAPGFVPAQPLDPACRLWLGGPFTGPTLWRARGEGQVLQLMFQPDALHALAGVQPRHFVDRVLPARALLGADWRAWADAVAAAGGDGARLALVEGFLGPRWQGRARSAQQRFRDWADDLAWRAATSAAGRSLRQAERRIKAWAGLPLRELRTLARGEAAFIAARSGDDSAGAPAPRYADIAAAHGYADQSHLSRETRRISGFSPTELERRVRSDPAFWPYRLWR